MNNEEKLHSIKSEICKIYKEIEILEANKNAYKSAEISSGIEAVLKANIKGIYKPLAQLASVKDDYIDAISVAMGSRAYCIVTDNQDVAHQAIQVLRSRHKGRASFIPLDIVQKAPTMAELPKEKGVVDYAINLIDFDDKYLDAYYFALGETIVVKNEQAAQKLAGKYRTVTLDGTLTEKSGLITGGTKRSLNIFNKDQEHKLEKYKQKLDELIKQERDLNVKINNEKINIMNEIKIKELDEKKTDIEKYIGFEMCAIDRYTKEIEQIQGIISDKTKILESLKCKLVSIKEVIPDFDIETHNCHKECTVLEDKIQQEKASIDILNAENIKKKDEVAKAEQILTEKKAELQMIEAELEVEIKNLIQN